MKKILCTSMFLIVLSSCGIGSQQPVLKTRLPHIQGKVVEIFYLENRVATILVEGPESSELPYYVARIGINNKTNVFALQGDVYTPSSGNMLKKGDQVKVLFTGPVGASMPPVATTQEIIMLKQE